MYTDNITKKALVERLIKEDKISLDEGLLLLEIDNEPVPDQLIVPYTPIYPGTIPWQQPWYLQQVTVSPDSGTTPLSGTIPCTSDSVTLLNADISNISYTC